MSTAGSTRARARGVPSRTSSTSGKGARLGKNRLAEEVPDIEEEGFIVIGDDM